KNDFDYQVTFDEWQISHKTTRGYYVNVDFGFGERGKVLIGAYKVDPLENGQYNIYVKRKVFFYLMNEKNADRNRYMT
ncbi:transcription elongation factor GreAB, partial [Enterococcus faecalis]